MANTALLFQIASTVAAVGVLVAVAAWAKICRPPRPLDDRRAHDLFAMHFPGRELEAVWVGADGNGAIAKSGAAALVLCVVGDVFAVRVLPWAQVLNWGVRYGRICVDLTDDNAPKAFIPLSGWPPESLTAPLTRKAAAA